jgi:4-hydroxy-3-polyprenylbenzoate decarboxylase
MLGESPFHKGHFRLMSQAADIGAIITLSAVSFYTRPETIQDLVDQTVARTLNIFGIKIDSFKRWSQADGEKAMDLLDKERGLQK